MKLLSTIAFLLLFLCSHSQTKMLWGKVIDENFQNIAGTIIRTPDSKHQTLSDEDGNYRIEIPINYDTLIFQFVGMITQHEAIQSRCYVDVILPMDRHVDLNTKDDLSSVEKNKRKQLQKTYIKGVFQNNSCYESPNILYGKLFDKYQQPIEGCNILVKGQIKGTITGKNGEFTLNDVSENETLVFSCMETCMYAFEYPIKELKNGWSFNFGIKKIGVKDKSSFKYNFKKNEVFWLN